MLGRESRLVMASAIGFFWPVQAGNKTKTAVAHRATAILMFII
jgi:hypothetical protein